MRKLFLIVLVLAVSGCAWFRDPPEQGVTTGATVVYSGGRHGFNVFSLCDAKGHLVFLSEKNPQLAVVKDGCLGPAGPVSLSPATIAALTERTPERVPQPTPLAQPPAPTVPQPLLVQLVPAPVPPVESRAADPVIVQIQPVAPCPACPVAPPILAPPSTSAPPAARRAPRAVAQLDPNTASVEDLERLPGVTAKTAQAITRGRPYRSLRELVDRKALTDAELAGLTPYFVIR